MIVVATLRVRSKRAEQLLGLLRGLSAYIALEAEPTFECTEDEIHAPEPEKEVIHEQGLRGAGDEAGPRDGHEEAVEDAGVDLAVECVSTDGVAELAGPAGEEPAEVASEQHADVGIDGAFRGEEDGALTP